MKPKRARPAASKPKKRPAKLRIDPDTLMERTRGVVALANSGCLRARGTMAGFLSLFHPNLSDAQVLELCSDAAGAETARRARGYVN